MGFLDGSDSKESACNAGDWALSLAWKDPLKKEMAIHSSTLTWRIPWTEEPGQRAVGRGGVGNHYMPSPIVPLVYMILFDPYNIPGG